MELKFTDVNIENIIAKGASQAYIEGAVPLPEGRVAAEPLSAGGSVILSPVSVRDGSIHLEGKLKLEFICSEQGEPFAFMSSAAFEHSMPVPEAKEGLTAKVSAQLTTLDISGAGPFSIAATADISFVLASLAPSRLFDGIMGADDLEKLEDSFTITHVRDAGYQNVRMRDEIPFSGGDGAERVVVMNATPLAVRGTREGDTVHIDGSVAVAALAKTHSGAYKMLNASVPYSAEASAAGLSANEECALSASIDCFDLKPMGDTGDTLSAELSLTVKMSAMHSSAFSCVLDAYSPSLPFECEYGDIKMQSLHAKELYELEISSVLTPPEGMPKMAALVCCTARPTISSAAIDNGELTVDGIAFTKTAYLTESGSIYAFTGELPFSLTKPVSVSDGAALNAHAAVTVCECALTAGGVNAHFKLQIAAEISDEIAVRAVTGICECEKRACAPGLYIYCADEGEKLFCIGKRFNMPLSRLCAANPDISDPCQCDTRIIVLV